MTLPEQRKILVIGAFGFIGRHIAQALRAGAHAVRCLARTPTKVQDLATLGCEIVKRDISDLASVTRASASIEAV